MVVDTAGVDVDDSTLAARLGFEEWSADRSADGCVLIVSESAEPPARSHSPQVADVDGCLALWTGVRHTGDQRDEQPIGLRANDLAEAASVAIRSGGVPGVGSIVGEWRFVHWDPVQRELTAMSDAVGLDQIYFHRGGGTVVLGATARCLIESGLLPVRLDEDYVRADLAWRAIDARKTGWEGIEALLGGDVLTFSSSGKASVRTWWFPPEADTSPFDPAERQEEFDALLLEVIRSRLPLGAEVGLYLSGGVDSTALAALLAQVADVHAITAYSSRHSAIDEREHARRVVAQLGMRHTEVDVADCWALSADVLSDSDFDQCVIPVQGPLLRRLLQCAGDVGVDVVFDGNGGDELLQGPTLFLTEMIKAGHLSRAWSVARFHRTRYRAARFLGAHTAEAVRRAARGRLRPPQDEVPDYPSAIQDTIGVGAPYRRWSASHVSSRHLPAVTSPLLDVRIFRFVARNPEWLLRYDGWPRALLRTSGSRYLDRPLLERRGKAYFDGLAVLGIEREPARVEHGLAALVAHGLVEQRQVDQQLDEARKGDARSAVRVVRHAGTGLWLSTEYLSQNR